MPALLESPPKAPLAAPSESIGVWDRLWTNAPSDAKDDHLLARERRSPRSQHILGRLQSTFGEIRGLRVIELGCGRGDLSALLAERGAQVTLFDASDRALAQARRRFTRLRFDANFVHADLLKPPEHLLSGFDVAVSTGVIEHFRGAQRTRAIAAHAAVVCDGGLVIISVPNANCILYRLWKLYLELRGYWPYGMEIPYDRHELMRRADAAGLSSCAVVGLGFWQSLGDHWMRSVLGRQVDWVNRRSALDHCMGMSNVLFARKPSQSKTTATAAERHFTNRGHGNEFEMEADWVRAHLPADVARVVDVGCGGGALFSTIGRGRVIGLDCEARGLSLTRQKHGDVRLACGSAEQLPFDEGTIEAITAQHVIEHLCDAESAVRRWHQALRPGGVALILTPNAEFVDPSIFDDPTHVRLYGHAELCRLLQEAGFAIVDVRTLGVPWFRRYKAIPAGWRLRRWVTRHARGISRWPGLRWRGQTLCVAARRPIS